MDGELRERIIETNDEDEIVESEEEETEESEEEETGGEVEIKNRSQFYSSLIGLTKDQFKDKAFFTKVIDDENLRAEKNPSNIKVQLAVDNFKWDNGELKMMQSSRLRSMMYLSERSRKYAPSQKKRRDEKKKDAKHQTYVLVTISQDEIEGMSLRQIWEYLKGIVRSLGWYVGETLDFVIGARAAHFRGGTAGKESAVQQDMRNRNRRCFEVAVIVSGSEEERKNLEEFIIHYLAEQEEMTNGEMKMLNKKTDLKISPALRAQAKNLSRTGRPLVTFEGTGHYNNNDDPFDLGYVCSIDMIKEGVLTV